MSSSRKEPKAKRPPATTPEARENQMINLAVDLAEKQMMEGTAPAQVVTHYLKLATVREKLEREKLAKETRLLEAKVDAIESAKRIEELYGKALDAMRGYQGHTAPEEYDEEEL